jgi:hypothetical protein
MESGGLMSHSQGLFNNPYPDPNQPSSYTTILSDVLYSCETWSLTLKYKYRIMLFENRILKRIFGPERDGNGEWGRLHNEELHSLYPSPNLVRVINLED